MTDTLISRSMESSSLHQQPQHCPDIDIQPHETYTSQLNKPLTRTVSSSLRLNFQSNDQSVSVSELTSLNSFSSISSSLSTSPTSLSPSTSSKVSITSYNLDLPATNQGDSQNSHSAMVGNQMRCDKSVVQTHFMTSKMPAPNCASLFATSPLNSPKLLPPPFSSASSTPASSTFYPNPVAPEISTSSCSPVNFMATSHTLEFPTKDRKCQGGDDEGFEPQSVTTSNLLNLTTSGKFSKYLVQPPPTGSDGLRYESLDTAALSNKGIQLSLPTGDAKFCPVSSMEFAESWLFTTDTSAQEDTLPLPLHPMVQPVTTSDVHHSRLSSDQQSIHPLQMDPEPRLSFSSIPISPSNSNSIQMANPAFPLSHPVIDFLPESTMVSPQAQSGARKRSMLVSRIRKVFIKPTMSSSAKDQQEQLEATKRQQHSLEDIASLSSSLSPPGSELDQHRGSVSSSSSNESMSVGQAEFGINSPLTSPEISPTGSPKLKYALPEMHRFKNTQSFAAGVEAQFNASTTPTTPNAAKQSEKRLSLEPTPTRTVKKRLSFASITSFFNPRGSDAATAIATKKKQQRSSSVPNVESPLAIVGRQISGFQRRHSLNDMPECPGSKQLTSLPPQKLVISPWDKDLASAQTAAVTAEMLATTQSRTPSEKVGESIKKSKIYGVFGKQSKKKNKSGSENSTVIAADSSVAVNSSTKPLRPTLTQHHQRSPSLSKVPSNRSSIYEQGHNPQREQQQQQQQQGLSSIKRSSYSGPSVSLPQEAGPGSRRASEEQQSARLGERIVGPTRHRRQSSIAGRQATQQGYYPVLDRKQRHSIRYSSDSERDSMYYLESPTTSCQAGGLMVQRPAEYEIMNAPPKPRTTPVSTALSSPTQTPSYQISALSHTSPRRDSFTSISGTEDGQFPLSMQESSMSAHHSHHRNSIHQTENIGGIVFNNSSHCSSIVSTTSPAPRQPVDHSIHMEFSGHTSTATPRSATLPLSSVSAMPTMPNASHQQQQQYLLYQQQQQQQFLIHQRMHAQHQQFQRALQQQQHQQFLQQQHYQQQFMNIHAFSSPPQSPSTQESFHHHHHAYSHPYQFNLQQPIPSHLYYSSAQHPIQHHIQLQQQQQYTTNGNNIQYGPMTTASTLYPAHISNNRTPTSPTPSSSNSLPSCFKPASSKQIQFSTAQPIIHQTWAPDQYDRTSDPNITAHRLTQAIAQKIKLELNQFKSQEMIVHQDSRTHTHFFV